MLIPKNMCPDCTKNHNNATFFEDFFKLFWPVISLNRERLDSQRNAKSIVILFFS